MERSMKNQILRILLSGILFSLISSIVVIILGFVLGWKTATQFSDGFFWAGAIMIILGFISFQGYNQRGTNWLPAFLTPTDRTEIWAADTFRGKIIMAVFGISGLLLFSLSIIISKLF